MSSEKPPRTESIKKPTHQTSFHSEDDIDEQINEKTKNSV